MWPQLFGPGWEFGMLAAGAILAAFGSAVWFAMRNPHSLGPDPVADMWRRYEQGDLTSGEAARLFRQLAHQHAEVEQAGRQSGPTPRPRWKVSVWRAGRARAAAPTIKLADARRPDFGGPTFG